MRGAEAMAEGGPRGGGKQLVSAELNRCSLGLIKTMLACHCCWQAAFSRARELLRPAAACRQALRSPGTCHKMSPIRNHERPEAAALYSGRFLATKVQVVYFQPGFAHFPSPRESNNVQFVLTGSVIALRGASCDRSRCPLRSPSLPPSSAG